MNKINNKIIILILITSIFISCSFQSESKNIEKNEIKLTMDSSNDALIEISKGEENYRIGLENSTKIFTMVLENNDKNEITNLDITITNTNGEPFLYKYEKILETHNMAKIEFILPEHFNYEELKYIFITPYNNNHKFNDIVYTFDIVNTY